MTRTCLCLLTFSTVVAATQQPPRDRPPAATGTAFVIGRVVIASPSSSSATPLRRARIRLDGAIAGPQFTGTDIEGQYRFDRLVAGSYTVAAEKPGYVGRSTAIVLKDGERLRADVVVTRAAALEGRILTEDGEPAQNVTVSASRFVQASRGRRPSGVWHARTDDLGRFRVHSLPPGDYYVDVAQTPIVIRDGIAIVDPGTDGVAHTFYPGTPRLQDARRVRVGVGDELSGLDFTIARVPLAGVSGMATNSAGTRSGSFTFRLQPVSQETIPGLGDRSQPVFIFSAVPPGEYWLTASATPGPAGNPRLTAMNRGPSADPEFFAMRLTVAGNNLADLIVRTERGARLEGIIEVDATTAVAPSLTGVNVVAHEVEFELPGLAGSAAASPVVVGADGRFTIRSVFGPRIIHLDRLPRGWALKRAALDERDITDVAIDFRATTIPRTLRLLITNRTATVTGTVTNVTRALPGEVQVIVFAEDERLWAVPSRFVKSAHPIEGRFLVDGLLPGAYLICAAVGVVDDSPTDPDVLRRLRSVATTLMLAEGEQRSVALSSRDLP